jgi:flagellar biosynthesis/type III secretory pathway protein FliH
MSENSEETQHGPALTVETYKPTQYADTGWPTVGKFENNNSFVPMEFRTLSDDEFTLDPMFSDFGGQVGGTGARRHGVGAGSVYSPTRKLTEEDIVNEVERRIQIRLVEHAQQLEEVRSQALEEGKAIAIAEAEERSRQLEERYIGVLDDIGAQLNESLVLLEQQGLNLALEISNKLVGTIVDVNPEYIISIIKEGIALAGGAKIKSIKVSAQDLEFLNLLNLSKQFKEFDGGWQFEADDSIKSGCVVEMAGGVVDYQIDKAWERIRDQVVKVR